MKKLSKLNIVELIVVFIISAIVLRLSATLHLALICIFTGFLFLYIGCITVAADILKSADIKQTMTPTLFLYICLLMIAAWLPIILCSLW